MTKQNQGKQQQRTKKAQAANVDIAEEFAGMFKEVRESESLTSTEFSALLLQNGAYRLELFSGLLAELAKARKATELAAESEQEKRYECEDMLAEWGMYKR